MDARAALQRLANWYVLSPGWWWWRWDVSFVSITHIGAVQLGNTAVQQWAEPVYRAFLAGCWLFVFTDETLYWCAKPTVSVEQGPNGRRLHNDHYAAIENDIENIYFFHGVEVPAFVVVKPEWITIDHIRNEENQEVRRIMIERMGWTRFCEQAKVSVLASDCLSAQFPALPVSELVHEGQRFVSHYRVGQEKADLLEASEFRDFEDRPLRFVRVTDPSTDRQYIIRVTHDCKTPYEGIGASFGMTEKQYKQSFYLRQGDVCLKPLHAKINPSQHS